MSERKTLYIPPPQTNLPYRQPKTTFVINSLINKGIITRTSTGYVLAKPEESLSETELKQLQSAGFRVINTTSTTQIIPETQSNLQVIPTTQFNFEQIQQQNQAFAEALASGKITQAEYNQAMAQQNANWNAEIEQQNKILQEAISSGLIKVAPATKAEQKAGTQSIQLAKPVTDYTNQEIKQLQELGFEFSKKKLSATKILLEKGTVTVEGETVILNKPPETLTDSEIFNLKLLGINVPHYEKGPQMGLFEWGQKTFADNGALQAGTQFASSVLGQVITDGANLLRFATQTIDPFNLIPDVDIKFRGPTLENLGYMVHLSEGQKPFLTTANVALGVGEGLIFGAGLGKGIQLTSKGIGKIAQTFASNPTIANAIAKLPSFKGPATATNIARWMTSHPQATNALFIAPMFGMEAVNVINEYNAGVPTDEIIERALKNVGFGIGTIGGMNLLTKAQQATLRRATKIEGVQTSNGTKLVLSVDTKKIPRQLLDLVQMEYNQQLNKVVLVGVGKSSGARFPMTIEMSSQMWDDLVRAGQLGPEYLTGTLMKWVDPKEFEMLISKYPQLKNMKPQQIYEILYKEIGPEGPWAKSVDYSVKKTVLTGKENFSLDLKAAFTSGERNLIEVTYNKLIEMGVPKDKVAYITSNIFIEDVDTVSGILRSLKLNPSQQAEILAIRFEAGGPSRGGTFIYKALKQGGVPDTEIKQIIDTIVLSKGTEGVSKVLSGGIPKLSNNGMKAILDILPEETLYNLKFSPELLSRVVPAMNTNTLTRFAMAIPIGTIALMDTKTLSYTFESLTPEVLNTFINKLNVEPKYYNPIIGKLNSNQLQDVFEKVNTSQIPTIFTSLTTENIQKVIPILSQTQIDTLLTSLQITPAIIQKYLQTGQLPSTLPKELSPKLLRVILNKKIKQNKSELEKQKSTFFDVRLNFPGATNDFKVKSNSFDSAARNALVRSVTKELPLSVTIRKLKETNQ